MACRRLGFEADFRELIWGEHDELLKNGDIDCIWCSYAMNGREDDYSWAGPYMSSNVVVVVPADSGITDEADLNGKSIAVRVASQAEANFLKGSEPGIPRLKNIMTFSDMSTAFAFFGKGYADAATDYEITIRNYTDRNPELYRVLDEPIACVSIGVAFSKEYDDETVQRLTSVLHDMEADGTIEDIKEKYTAYDKG